MKPNPAAKSQAALSLSVGNGTEKSRGGNGGPPRGPAKLKKINTKRAGSTELPANRKVLPKIRSNVDRYDDMLAGALDDLLPKPPSEVRIFLSSTFSDYRKERNWLTRESYGELQEFCADLDLDFRVVDMRWGVTDDATNEHITEKLCLSEIATCKRVSLGPNFVGMLGNRYGYQPLQYAFIAKEFEILYNEAKELGHPDVESLHRWYSRDNNNVPPVYCIKPIKDNLPGFGDHSPGMEEAQGEATKAWQAQHLVLHDVLRAAATSLAAKKIITETRRHDFYKSVTETEVTDGILEADGPADHALCYMRSYEGLNAARLGDTNALRNIDGLKVDGKLEIDEEVVRYQNALKEDGVPSNLTSENIRPYRVPWENGGIDPDSHAAHQDYLRTFCNDFVVDLKRLVQKAVYQKQRIIPQSEYYIDFDEALHHSHFCVSKCSTFRGQEVPLGKIKEYLSNTHNRKPLTVYAESGVGKTSILAMAMKLIPKWFGPETIRIIRFLGTSPNSGTLYDTLFGVMGQLADNFDIILEPVSYTSTKRIKESLPRFLRIISRKTQHPVFIFLDSIDQLSAEDNTFSMQWLPTELPPKVHIVLSMIPSHENLLSNTRKVINDEKCFIEVQPLPLATGKDIIESYLKSKGRKVTPDQQKLLMDCLQHEPSPLFLKLFLDKALSWRSDTPVDAIRIEASVSEAITHLFEDLEAKFGECLIQRALGYITVGLNGLSELELEDVLSCDDSVLDEVYVYHDPPVPGIIKVPPLLWARIKIHVHEYLTERQSFGKTTLFWYHRQFIEVARQRYTKDNHGKVLHRRLAELYLSEKGVKKDITLSKRKNLMIPKADRQVTPQPMVGRNRRMLQCLPYHLCNAQNTGYTKQVALCNLRFLMTRMAGFSGDVLLKDFTDCMKTISEFADLELEMMVNALKAAKPSLRKPSQLPLQLLCRLQYDRKSIPHVSNLLDMARQFLERSDVAELLPLHPCLANTSELMWSAQGASICSMSSDRTRFVIKVTSTVMGGESPQARFLVLDASAQRVILKENLASEKDQIPHISKDGKKLIRPHILKRLPVENAVSKTKGAPAPPKVGDYVLEIVDDAALRTGTCSPSHLVNLRDHFIIEELHSFAVTRDGAQVALVYNTSVFTLFDVKTAAILKNERHDMFSEVTDLHWLGKTYCLFFGEEAGQAGVLILSTNSKKKEIYLRLPGKVKGDSIHWLAETTQAIISVVSDEGEKVMIIDIKTGQIKDVVDIPEGKVKFNLPLPQDQGNMILSTENKLYMMKKGQKSTLAEISVEPVKKQMHELICAGEDHDASLVVFGDSAGMLHLCQRQDEILRTVAQTKLTSGAIKDIYLNEEEEVLVSVSDSEICLWHWPLIKAKLAPGSTKGAGTRSGSSLVLYRSATSFEFSEDGQNLLTISPTEGVTVWDLVSQDKVRCFGKGVDPKVSFRAVGGTILVALDQIEERVYAWEVETGAELDELKYLHGSSLAITKNPNSDEVYVLANIEGKFCITVIDMADRKIIYSIPLKERFDTKDIELALSDNQKHLFFKVHATPIQLDILLKSEKKNNLKQSEGKFLFYAVDLKARSGEMVVCKRQLSSVPCLGESWLVHKDSSLIIGRSRVTVVWDVDTGSTDQRMAKGKKMPQFYRPELIEHEASSSMQICKGQTPTMFKSANKKVVGIGSLDGWVVFFNAETGLGIGGNFDTKQPPHQGQVLHVVISPDGRWAASYSSDTVLKVWQLPRHEMASLKLGLKVRQISFAADSLTLGVLGINGLGSSSFLSFRIVGKLPQLSPL